MSMEVYAPSEQEQYLAKESFLRYVAGVAILHNPIETQTIHQQNTETNPEAVAIFAKGLIIGGLQKVIRLSHPARLRSSLSGLEMLFDEALPHMSKAAIQAYDDPRAQEFFPAIRALHPKPILDETVYKRICHGQYESDKLTTDRLMDGATIHESMAKFVVVSPVASNLAAGSESYTLEQYLSDSSLPGIDVEELEFLSAQLPRPK